MSQQQPPSRHSQRRRRNPVKAAIGFRLRPGSASLLRRATRARLHPLRETSHWQETVRWQPP
jgi:hypothetical protein